MLLMILVFDQYLNDISMQYMIHGKVFHMSNPSVWHYWLKTVFFSLEFLFHLCKKSIEHIYIDLESSFLFFGLCVCLSGQFYPLLFTIASNSVNTR